MENIFLMMIDGSKLPTNMRQRVANGTLYIDTVQRNADNGTYTCTARNKHNFTSHRTVEVNVLGKFQDPNLSSVLFNSNNFVAKNQATDVEKI